jgi:hypothetical protein
LWRNTQAKKARYFGGAGGAEFALVKVIGGGRTWPGGKQLFVNVLPLA